MKKLKGIFLFFIFTFAFYFSLLFILFGIKDTTGRSYIYNTADYYLKKGGNSYRTFHNFNREQPYDIVVMGGSHAYRGYDPRIFSSQGYQLYTLGSSNQSISNTYFAFKEYVKTHHVKMVLLDIYDEGFLDNGAEFEAAADMIPNLSGGHTTPLQMALGVCDFRALNMCVLRALNDTTTPVNMHEKQYVMNGYCANTDSIKAPLEPTIITDKIDAVKLYYFKKLLKHAAEQQIKIVAVNHPIPNPDYAPQHKRLVVAVQPHLDTYGIPFLDYAYALTLDAHNHFYDYTHMNQAGVNMYNARLIDDLKKQGHLN